MDGDGGPWEWSVKWMAARQFGGGGGGSTRVVVAA